ncbi:MAG: phosphoesterase [Acidobacteria bacterium]|nr:MAG: phosphoesterase [Acidobacteriota bacterium]
MSLLTDTLNLPNGARFYCCALQVNPFAYVKRHKKTAFPDEESYNRAIVGACKKHGIDVIAITDHYRVRTAETLAATARSAGISVFLGFEAETKDGIHLLCLFDLDEDVATIDRRIGECGIHSDAEDSPIGDKDAEELLAACAGWGGLCIAAHVTSAKGLLSMLSGQARIRTWTAEHLLAAAIPGRLEDTPENLRNILDNSEPEYRREHPVALINASDVSSPEDLAKPGASCWIKMSEVRLEGLRQAFLDPDSRIRLASDPEPQDHPEIEAICWEGGFLGGTGIHWNANLNVLIGGRGTGKSTVIESLRHVLALEPVGDDARTIHQSIVKDVIKSGTKISLSLRSPYPTDRRYLIRRIIPNQAEVFDDDGQLLDLSPADLVPGIEIYGQHEIAELARDATKRTRLLGRFLPDHREIDRRKTAIRRELARNRRRLNELREEIERIEDRLAKLPAIEEQLSRYQQVGLEERLRERALLLKEEQVLEQAKSRIETFHAVVEHLDEELPIDLAFVSASALDPLPGREILAQLHGVLSELGTKVGTAAKTMRDAVEEASSALSGVRERWDVHRARVQEAYETTLRDLQKGNVDGEEFIKLKRQIERMRPERDRLERLRKDHRELKDRRQELLSELVEVQRQAFEVLRQAAQEVGRQLRDQVRVEVHFMGSRQPLYTLLRDRVGGTLKPAIEALERYQELAPQAFAQACRDGEKRLREAYRLSRATARRIAGAGEDVFMCIEELDFESTAEIELNVGSTEPSWQKLESLSEGQKATAVLLLLLLESDAPLIVDQPEDDLDNRFISEAVVPRIREGKRRRQFIFSTHNANIPVLGDAELIVGLQASSEAAGGERGVERSRLGSIDKREVQELVEELLEGGRAAFETRRRKYGF